MQRLRELEKETLHVLTEAWANPNQPRRGRQIEEAEREYQRFLSWLGKYIADPRKKLQNISNSASNSAIRDKLMSVTAIEARTNFRAWSSFKFSLAEDQLIINDLQQHKLLCSEFVLRYHRLASRDNRCHQPTWEEYTAFVELWEKIMTKAMGVLSSAPSSIGEVRGIVESLGWFSYNSFDRYTFYQGTLEEGLDVTPTGYSRDSIGRTAAHQWLDVMEPNHASAVWLEDFKTMTASGATDLDSQDFLGRTLLHITCQQQSYLGTAWLLEKGANPGIATGYGHLPLHYAAANGSEPICRLLLTYRHLFNVDELDCTGLTAIDYATASKNRHLIAFFSEGLIGDNKTVIIEPTIKDAAARGIVHRYSQQLGIATSEHLLDHESSERHQPQVTPLPLFNSDARAKMGSTIEDSGAISSGRSTTIDRFLTADASPTALTVKLNEVAKSLVVTIEYLMGKSVACNIEDVQVISAIIRKLHLHLYGGLKSLCAERSQFISSMEVLFRMEAELQNKLKLPSPANDLDMYFAAGYTVLFAMRHVEDHVESLTFDFREHATVGSMMRAIRITDFS
jgi:hypothetical protein